MANKEAMDYQQLVKNSLIEIRKLKAKVAQLEQHKVQEDIAVIGMACQFPTAKREQDINAFWQLLLNHGDAVTEARPERINKDQFYHPDPDVAGKIISMRGGYIHDIDQFDANFFFISPREAESMDPQQRMLLENHWRALEHAGIPPSSLMTSQTGLFVGICGNDYYHLLASRAYTEIDSYMASGTAHSTAVGRLAFYLGTQGPAIAVDTACSSSLIALHLACQSLRQGESDLALASGVNALLSPEYSINFSRAGMLSKEGCCKAFDDSADGYVRGEGCGVVVLKRLEDARQEGDNILALIKGSATNQDGRSSGLTAPNGISQRQVLSQALKAAGLTAEQVSYVEAHGTGTSLGDPIEIEALQAIYGQHRSSPLNIGSVKSNIGHLEGAAGIAGFIKTVLMLQHAKIPKQLHFHTPNQHVDWATMNLKVNQQLTDWNTETNQQRIAGVSSFGFGGSNAHILLAEAVESIDIPVNNRTHHLLTVSANKQLELQQLIQAYITELSDNIDINLADFCYSINTRRDHFSKRVACVCASVEDAINSLQLLKSNQQVFNIEEKRIAMLFTGQGVFSGVIEDFSTTLPLLQDELLKAEQAFNQQLGISLIKTLSTDQGVELMLKTEYAQPALFCFQYALAKTWLALGVEIEYFVGHSIGEYAAATLAGVFSFEQALAMVCHRGRLMGTMTEPAGMISVLASAETVNQSLQASNCQLVIAAYNSKTNTVVSGANAELMRYTQYLDEHLIAYVKLKVDRAFHSPLMAPMRAAFTKIAHGIDYQAPTKNIISTKTGKLIGTEIASADYWIDQINQPVLFTQAIEQLLSEEVDLALEIGPKGVLSKMLQQEYPEGKLLALSSINDQSSVLDTLSILYQKGLDINWQNYYQSFKGQYLDLPGYPFSRKKYWFNYSARTVSVNQHPLLQSSLVPANQTAEQIFTALLTADNPAFNQDHRYKGKILIPAAHYLEMTLAAFGSPVAQLSQVSYPAPLLLDEEDQVQLQLILTTFDTSYDCAIYARSTTETSAWQCHFKAQLKVLTALTPTKSNPPDLTKALDVDRFYQAMADRGIEFAERYQLIEQLFLDDKQAKAKIKMAGQGQGYYLYPPMLDACFQIIGVLLPENNTTYVQTGIESLECYAEFGQQTIYAYARITDETMPDKLQFDIDIVTSDAQFLARIKGIQLKQINQGKQANLFYKTQWQVLTTLSNDIETDQINHWLKAIARDPEKYCQSPQNTDSIYLPELEKQALSYVIQTLLDLAWPYQLDQTFNLQQCSQQLKCLPRYQKLLKRCLMALTELGYLTLDQQQWKVVRPLVVFCGEQHAYIESSIEMKLLRQCGQSLAKVLTGETDFLPLLFPENSDISATTLYSHAAGFKLLNESAVQALKGWLALVPKARKLKILEIGAGTGGSTRYILPLLAESVDFEYCYTDLSAAFFSHAKSNFSDYGQLYYQTLDISQNPKKQGFVEEQYDLIIAANVMHATEDLEIALRHVKQLISPNGVLMLLEGLKPQLWIDLIFGLTEGWWAFSDHRLGQNYPLLDENGWQQLFTRTGFRPASLITAKHDASERLCQQSVILTQPVSNALAKNWLILKDQQDIAGQVATYLTGQGAACTLVSCGHQYVENSSGVTINPFQVEDFDKLLNYWLEKAELTELAVLNYWSLDAKITDSETSQQVADKLSQLCAGTLHLVQALAKQNITLQAFNFVTQGAQQVNGKENLHATMTALWGLVRVVAKEYPQFHCRLLDLPSNLVLTQRLLKEISQTGASSEPQCALRDQQIFVPRLQACPIEQIKGLIIKAQAVYLITGAFGGMGFKITQWLIEQGAKHLILLARTAPSESIKQWLAQQKDLTIHIAAIDISDYQKLQLIVKKHSSEEQPLAGIFHSAGVFADCLLQDYNWPVFSKVFPSKVQGSWNLHYLSVELNLELDYFVLFSSSASILAPSGLANYVAANAFVDTLAVHRQQQNLPALSINWGVWQDIGMASAVGETRKRQWQVMGVEPMPSEATLKAMQKAMSANEANLAIIKIDFDLYVSSLGTSSRENYFQSVQSQQTTQTSDNTEFESIASILQQNPEHKEELMQQQISKMVCSVLGISADIDPRRGFFELGMDSLTSMELANRLQRELDISLDSTLTFKYPSVLALSEYLLSLLIDDRVETDVGRDDLELLSSDETSLSLDEQLEDIDRLLEGDD